MNLADSTSEYTPDRNGRIYPPEVMERAVLDHLWQWRQRALASGDNVSMGSHSVDSVEVVGDTMHVNMTLRPIVPADHIDVQYKIALEEVRKSLDGFIENPPKTRYQLLLEQVSTDTTR